MQQYRNVLFKFVTILYVVANKFTVTDCDECVDLSDPKLRSFPTLLHLQANRRSFKADDSDFAGNYVTIEEDLRHLGRNSFISYTSRYVIKLFLNDRHVGAIDDGCFASLDCLSVLDLQANSIKTINRDTFEGLTSLRELNLGRNDLGEVPENSFALLGRLRLLNLTGNSIRTLRRESFNDLSSLEVLDLSHNYLSDLPPDTLKYFKVLRNLQLASNLFDRMEKWNLPSLRTLNLSNNVLVSFDTTYQFPFGSTLKQLCLDHNYLSQLNSYGLSRHLPNLTTIEIDENPWSCQNLLDLVTTLNATRVSFTGGLAKDTPNVNGLECNRTKESYAINKIADVTEEPATSVSTHAVDSKQLELKVEKILNNNEFLIESVKRANAFVVTLFAVVVLFILIDIVIRNNVINSIKRRFSNSYRTGANVNTTEANSIENLSLLLNRY